LHETVSFDVFNVKIRTGVLAVDDAKNLQNSRVNIREKETPYV